MLERLDLRGEDVSTQVVPRDRHADLLQAIALAGAGLERFATEIRHLQRTEVREVEEPFRAGQKGSSAMPHKRNPITTERITGLARVLRGYAQAAYGERRAVARARHLALRRRARDPPRRHDPHPLHAAPGAARRARDDGPPGPDGAQPRPHLRRPVLPDRAARAGRARDGARRRLPDRPGGRPARVGHADAAARAARRRAGRRRARPRRAVRLRALHAPHPRAARRGSTRSSSRRPHERAAAPARRPVRVGGPLPRDPARHHRPVPLRRAGRPPLRGQQRARARPDRGARPRHRDHRPVRARDGRPAQRRRRLPRGRDRVRPAGPPPDRHGARDRAARLPARLGRPPARGASWSCGSTPTRSTCAGASRPPPSSPASAAPRSPPTRR